MFPVRKIIPMISLGILSFLCIGGAAEAETSTLKDQQSVALTIYNSNVGVVKETRLVNLPQGIQTLRFTDVPGRIDPPTVNLKSLIEAAGVRVLEQNFEYDLVRQQRLLEKFVGQKVDLSSQFRVPRKTIFVLNQHSVKKCELRDFFGLNALS